MATADEYAAWIVQNADKKGTPDFDIVVKAYQEAAGARPPQRATLGDVASHTGKALLATMQGPTFGFGDEIIGGVVGGAKSLFNDKPLRQNYEETRDAVRSVVKQQERDEPVRTAASQLLTSMAWGGPLARFLPAGTGMAKQAATVGGVGMVSGAVNALGDSQAKDASGLAGDAGVGAGIGLAMGGLGVPLMRGAGAAGQAIASNFSDSAALQYARQKVAEAFARDQRPVQQAVTRMDRLGPEATVADTGGQNTRQLLDTLALLPGRTKDEVESVIRNRQAGRADRMIDAAESASGTGGLRMSTEMRDWMAQRAQAAAPLYARAYQMSPTADSELVDIITRADRLGATAEAKIISTARLNEPPYSLDLQQPGRWSIRDLDRVKQGFDQLLTSKKALNQDGTMTPVGAAYDQLRKALVSKLDDMTGGANGVYAQARQAYAGPSQMMDAATAGRNALTKDDATIKTMQAGMSRSEKDAFALGAFEALRAKLGTRAGQTQLMELWREKGMKEKLRAIFGNEKAYLEFASSVAKERQLKQLETVRGNSKSVERMYAVGDLDMPAIQAAGQMVGNASAMNVPGVLQSGANLWSRVKLPEPARDQMGQILLSRNRQGLLDLEDTMRQVEESRRRQAASYGISMPGLLGF